MYYILLLLVSLIVDYKSCAAEFEFTPLNINFNGVVASGDTIVAYGDYGSMLLSFDNGKNWEQIRVFKSGKIMNYFFEIDRIVAFCSNGKVSISKNGGLNWNEIADLNDELLGVIKHPKGYATRSNKWLKIINSNFVTNSSIVTNSIKNYYKNYIYGLYKDEIDYNQTMTIFKNELIVSSDSATKFIRFDNNLTPKDTFNVYKRNECEECLRNYYVYSDSNSIYFLKRDSVLKSNDFYTDESIVKLDANFKSIKVKDNVLFILNGFLWGGTNYETHLNKYIKKDSIQIVSFGKTNLICANYNNVLKGYDFNNKSLFVVEQNKILLKNNHNNTKIEILSEFSNNTFLLNPDFGGKQTSIFYTGAFESGKYFLGALSNNLIYKSYNDGVTFKRIWGDSPDSPGFIYFRLFNEKNHRLILGFFDYTPFNLYPEISGLYESLNFAESFKFLNTASYIFTNHFDIISNIYKNKLGYELNGDLRNVGYTHKSYSRSYDDSLKLISVFIDSNYTVYYSNSKDTNSFLFQTFDDIDSTIIIKYTGNKGKDWVIINKFPPKYDLFYNKEIDLFDTTYLASAYINEIDHNIKFGLLNLENRKYSELYSYNYNDLDSNMKHYNAITSDSNKIYLAVKDTIFEIFDYLNPNTWKQSILPNNGSIRKTFRKNNDKFLARYSDLNNEDNLYWIKITNKPKLIPEIFAVDNDFGNVDIKDNISKTQVMNIGNTSKNADLIITGYSNLTQNVFLTDLPKVDALNPIIIQPNTYYHFQVQFKPTAVKKYLDSILFYSNAVISDSVTYLKGEGIDTVKSSVIEDLTYFYSYPPFPIPAMNELKSLIYWDMSHYIDDSNIGVYDIYGNKIADREKISINKLNGYSGYLTWDCSGVTTGVYMIQIKHGTNTHNIRAMVVR